MNMVQLFKTMNKHHKIKENDMEERAWHKHYDSSVPAKLRYPDLMVHELLDLPVSLYPDKPFINYYGSLISFSEVKDDAIKMANVLKDLGVKKGDRVGINLPNTPQYIISYYAVLYLGAIVVNYNPLLTPTELTALVKQTGTSAFLTFDMVLPNMKEVCKEVSIPIVIVTSVFDYFEGTDKSDSKSLGLENEWHHFSELLDNCTNNKRPKVEISQNDPALIQFTGGTTGTPKGAVLTHGNIVAGVYSVTAWGNELTKNIMIENRKTMCVLPLFHVYANIVCLNWSVINFSTLILVPKFELDEFMTTLSGFDKISLFPAVPTMINAIVNHPDLEKINFAKKVDLMLSGGAPIPTELMEKVKDLGIYCSEGLGMSETTSLGTSNPIIGRKKIGSIGIPFPNTDIRIVDLENGEKDVPQGEPGELLINGPLVMKEYWDNPEKTREELKDGWFHTGDIVREDEDHYLYVVDRKKDMVIAGGYNIYPRDIDEVLYQNPKVLDAVAVGIPDDYRGETIKAFVVLKEGETATEEEIINFCKEKLAIYKVPKSVEFRDDIPKSAVGKILRRELRDEEINKMKKE